NKLDHNPIIKFSLTIKKMENNSTLVFTVDAKANNPQIKHSLKKLHDIDVAEVNTLVRPEEAQEAYTKLVSDY
ncbi:hypothetical protein PANDA_018218, partial [Ailuropoda melanoleuca]